MPKNILISGVSGFAGSHLAEFLIDQADGEITGIYLMEDSLRNLSCRDKITVVKADLNDKRAVEDIVSSKKWDMVFHLAAFTSPADSFKNPSEIIINNVVTQIQVLEALKNSQSYAKVLIVSSADVYGKVSKQDLPISETTSFMPTNPYAVSKIAQDYLGLQYYLSYKLNIVRVRPFNHIGPRQSPHFVVSSLAKKIAEIEKGVIPPVLKVGNLSAKRDFTDVKDMVRAYVLILKNGNVGDVYNIGSGTSYSIEEILKKLLSLSKSNITIKVDQALFRPSDAPELLADSSKMRAVTHWKPEIQIDQTLTKTLDYWRNIV